MTRGLQSGRQLLRAVPLSEFALAVFLVAAALNSHAQTGPYERAYRQSKGAVERALKELQSSMSGRLPALDGFAAPGEHPLSRYQRAYYQTAVQVSSTASGGTVVRVSTKVTAWYADPSPSRAGYQLLISNGRIESDFLDQLSELLVSGASEGEKAGKNSDETSPVNAASAGNQQVSCSHGRWRSCSCRRYCNWTTYWQIRKRWYCKHYSRAQHTNGTYWYFYSCLRMVWV